MGFGASKPLFSGQTISRQQLLQNTAGAQKIINEMFEVMRTKLTPEDFLKLGNPAQCKTFVFMMADSIQNVFTALRIRPSRARDSGIVFFEEADSLKIQTPETKQLCLIIAYFFIRIFQIFGALAITVLDDPSAGPVLAATRMGPVQIAPLGRPKIQFGVRPSRQIGGAEPGYFTGPSQPFYPLRELFENPTILSAGKKQLRAFPFKDNTNYVLIPGRIQDGRNQNLKLGLDAERTIYAHMTISKIGLLPDIVHYKVILTNFLYKDIYASDKLALSKINMQLKNYKDEFEIYSDDRGKTWRSDKKRASVVEELDQITLTVQGIVQELEANPGVTLQAVKAARGRAAAAPIARPGEVPRPGVAAQQISRSDQFVTKALQNEYIINTLKSIGTMRPVGFCVARALQLIDASSLFSRQITTATSGVCFGSFQSRPSSAPEVGKTLDKMTGLRMVDQLFYTNPVIEQDKSQVQVSQNDAKEYADFLTKMANLFGKSMGTGGIDKIQVTENPGCVADAARKYLNITNPKAIAAIIKIVGQLFSRQLAHTKRVIAFYNTRLFQINRIRNPSGGIDLSYRLHPKILAGGLDELAKISKEARTILIEYYEGCEKIYQEGVKLVLQFRARN
jgi:hypothetical protein